MSIQKTLEERESQHGAFETHCEIERSLMSIVNRVLSNQVLADEHHHLTDVQHVGLHMIMHKIARILNQGSAHVDSWHDIAGYATLVEQHMTRFEEQLKDQADFDCGNSVG